MDSKAVKSLNGLRYFLREQLELFYRSVVEALGVFKDFWSFVSANNVSPFETRFIQSRTWMEDHYIGKLKCRGCVPMNGRYSVEIGLDTSIKLLTRSTAADLKTGIL